MQNNDDDIDLTVPWEAACEKMAQYAEDGDNIDPVMLLKSLPLADFENMPIEELCVMSALRSIGAADDNVLAIEATRIFETAIAKAREDFFPDGDFSELKIQMNAHLFTKRLKDQMIGYATGQKMIPQREFTETTADLGMIRRLI
jgi:hypothetical protein